jgi:hypothetical protein
MIRIEEHFSIIQKLLVSGFERNIGILAPDMILVKTPGIRARSLAATGPLPLGDCAVDYAAPISLCKFFGPLCHPVLTDPAAAGPLPRGDRRGIFHRTS